MSPTHPAERRLTIAGWIEGTSALILFLVAMPLKYLAGVPQAVKVFGTLHGGLFLAYLAVLLLTTIQLKWPFRLLVAGVAAAVVPLGPWLFDRYVASSGAERSGGT